MAYADQTVSTRKIVSIALVVLLHAALGYAFISGLAFNVVKKVAEDLKTFDVEDEPPPPPDEPPPPPEVPKQIEPPPVVTPPPVVVTPSVTAPVIQAVPVAPPPVITPTAPPAPPPPPAPRISQASKPRGNPGSWTSDADYPPSAIRDGVQGTVGFKLDIGTDGRVTSCTVTQSSGSSILDETTCRLLPRRARFTAAKDDSGAPIASSYSSRIRWQIPQN